MKVKDWRKLYEGLGMESKQLLTHSRLSCFRACPKKHFWRYEIGLRPDEDSFPLRIGQMFHRALEADSRGENLDVTMEEISDDPYDLALVAAMFVGYKRRWADESHIETLDVERTFDIPLTNPDTGASTPVWQLAGVLDRIVRLPDGRVALMEHKTTSRDFSPGADYWTRLQLDQQLSIYILAARAMGYDIQTVLYDVTRRPSLRPLKATPDDKRKYTKDGKLYANQRDQDETPEEFAARIAEDIESRPEYYYSRIEIARPEQDIIDCQAELWQQQLSIREAQRSGRWFKNPESCFGLNGTCAYLGLCQSRMSPDSVPPGFVIVDDKHPELSRVHNAGAGQAAQ